MTAPAHRERLRDWINVLRRREMLPTEPTRELVDEARASGMLWIQWSPCCAYGALYEAMELLALLARIDYNELVLVLKEMWPKALALWLRILDGKPIQLGIHVCTGTVGQFTSMCSRFLEEEVEFGASQTYERVRRQLEDELRDAVTDVVMPVRLTSEASDRDYWSSELWHEMRLLVALQTSRSAAGRSAGHRKWRPIFRIVELNMDNLTVISSAQDLLYARQLATSGVRVSPILLNALQMTEEDAPHRVPLLQQLLGTPGTVQVPLTDVLCSLYGHYRTSESLYSGLLVTTSVRDVAARGPSATGTNETRQWQWIALTVFSHRAPASIETFRMKSKLLSHEAVTAVATTLDAIDPLAVLFPATSATAEPSSLVATAAKFRLSSPSRTAAPDHHQPTWISFETPQKDLFVLSDSDCADDYVSVLLPGWGQAWVDRGEASFTSMRRPSQKRIKPNRQVVLQKLDASEMPLICGFLRAVGNCTRKISFVNQRNQRDRIFSSATMGAIFRSCPYLQELEFEKVAWTSLEDIATHYETGLCRVTKLVLDLTSLDDHQNAFKFFERLADNKHPMTRHLAALHVKIESLSTTSPHTMSVVAQMLQQNRSLYEFHIDLSRDGRAQNVPVDPFACYDGHFVKERLALTCKLAFLSVVFRQDKQVHCATKGSKTSATNAMSFPKAIHLLDTSALSIIFQFAARPRPRWVRVRM